VRFYPSFAHVLFLVYPVDEFFGGDALVSALLQDPFSLEAENVRISSRWGGRERDNSIDIECASYTLPILPF
jgi:hypothetical protein